MANAGHTTHKLRREIGIVGLLFAAVGSIIGSGWLFGALTAAEIAGPASVISWALGGLMIVLIGLTYAELGTMFPVSGGVVRFPHFSYGSFASYTLGWITWLSVASVTAIEVIAALQYANNYIPWLQKLDASGQAVLTDAGFVVAVVMLGLFSLVNVLGIGWFAKLNNVLVWWKLGVIIIVIIMFFYSSFHVEHFNTAAAGGFMPYGWNGVFSAIATGGIVFSYLGFRQGVELAGETRNPSRNVPIAVIGSLIVTALIYLALQVAFIGALPLTALSHGWANIGSTFTGELNHVAATFGPLAALAGALGMAWLAGLLYLDAFISPADTGLIFSTVTTRVSYAMGRNSNAPRSLAKVNARGVPWVSVILTFVAGVIFLLPFPGWQKLVGFVTSATVLSFGSGPLALLAMRRQLPAQARPFRLPWVHGLCYLAFLSSNLIVYWSGWTTVWKLMLAVLIGYIILIIHEARYHRETPPLQLRAGAWVPVWLAGLTVISYLGNYPEGTGAGNLHLLGIFGSIATLAVFSALIMWLALSLRLSPQQVQDQIRELEAEDAEDTELIPEAPKF